MKIRNGFVSNSSTSSFAAWGVSSERIEISDNVWLKIFQDALSEYEERLSKEIDNDYVQKRFPEYIAELKQCETNDEKIEYAQNEFDEEVKNKGNLTEGGPWDYERFVGIMPETFLKEYPDRKISEIPQIVVEEIKKQFNIDFDVSDVSYYEEGWRDG